MTSWGAMQGGVCAAPQWRGEIEDELFCVLHLSSCDIYVFAFLVAGNSAFVAFCEESIACFIASNLVLIIELLIVLKQW
jgi:predicted signal transduction protein with EAL and GGDEF domain